MVRRICGRPSWLFIVVAVAALAVARPVAAQSTGMVKGMVSDDKGQPVEGAKITIEMTGGTGRRYETKTDKKGQYMQIGLSSGQYKITAGVNDDDERVAKYTNPADIPISKGGEIEDEAIDRTREPDKAEAQANK